MPESRVAYDMVEIPEGELLYAIRNDCVAFFSFYIGEELDLEVPEFHIAIWQELLEQLEQANLKRIGFTLKKLFAVPREHAKSTIAKLAVILFLKYSNLSFGLYVSKTLAIAKNAIRDIMWFLQSPQEKKLFGSILIAKSSETEGLWIFDMWIREHGRDEATVKRVILKALGANSQVRGLLIMNRRPQIVIIDDIEDLDNTKPHLQPELDAWVMGSLMKSFDGRRSITIFIGNMIRDTTLLARFSKEPAWNATVLGSLVVDKATGKLRALWEGKNTVDGLLTEYAEFKRMGTGNVWEAEMMNLTRDEIEELDFKRMKKYPMPVVEQLESGMLTLDPAFGKNSWNDKSAITVHGRLTGITIPCIIDSIAGKWDEEELFDEMLEMSYRWGITQWCIESVAAQKLLIPYFKLLMTERFMREDLFQIVELSLGQASKASRIIAMRSSIAGGHYGVCSGQEDLVQKFKEYDPASTEKDDEVDSAGMGVPAWAMYGESVESQGIRRTLQFDVFGVGEVQMGVLDEVDIVGC